MWATVAGILGVSIVLACADTLYKELKNRPPPPDRIESDKFKATEADLRSARSRQQYNGLAKDVLGRIKNLIK